jgi:sugar phosphate isomerase/epimerase
MADIYIGTILLEKNRWAKGKQPSYPVSDWVERFRESGFDGMELWENHALLVTDDELNALTNSKLPVAIFNTYMGFTDKEIAAQERTAALIHDFEAAGVKFNLGADAFLEKEYTTNVARWGALIPSQTRLLCECHAGTIMEDPQKAREIFAAWEDPRFQAIVHPFDRNLKSLASCFKYLGPRITHAHVQLRAEGGSIMCLDSQPTMVKEALHIMQEEGFSGSFTLEFAEGTGKPEEKREELYKAALRDLAFLREHWV